MDIIKAHLRIMTFAECTMNRRRRGTSLSWISFGRFCNSLIFKLPETTGRF